MTSPRGDAGGRDGVASGLERVWYFAYGSNMQTATFAGRRGIAPTTAVAARAPGWRLVLDKAPLVPVGVSFATLVADPNAETFGVLYEIGADDMAHVELTEGVLIDNYRRVDLDAYPLGAGGRGADSAAFWEARAVSAEARGDDGAAGAPPARAGGTVRAVTLVSDRRAPHLRPSAHYMALIVGGAEEHGLPADWIAFLRAVPTTVEDTEVIAARGLLDDVLARLRR